MNRRRVLKHVGLAALAGVGNPARAAVPLHVPDEAAPHERTFMQWPVNRAVHDDPGFLADLQRSIARIANSIAQFEPVVMLAGEDHHRAARKMLSSRVQLWNVPTDDLWCRDSGPLFARSGDGKTVVSHLQFNGWGNKQVHGADGKIARRVADILGLSVVSHGLTGEAGGIETDGDGTLLAHESCWVNTNRNSASRDDITAALLRAYGARKIVWAPGIRGADITDYHIDALARFVRPGVVLIQMPAAVDPEDPWTKAAFQTRDILAAAKDAKGRDLVIEQISDPYNTRVQSHDFVGSYVNYYVCNGAVISAQFGDKDTDAKASATLKRLYPGREIITLNVDALGEAGGGIHCATQQQPSF